jgi:hypothetical protein
VSVTRGTVIKVAAVSGATGTARSVEEEGVEVAGDEETIERLILCSLKLQNNTRTHSFCAATEHCTELVLGSSQRVRETERIMIPPRLSPGIKR